jgi:hypothetical protein
MKVVMNTTLLEATPANNITDLLVIKADVVHSYDRTIEG